MVEGHIEQGVVISPQPIPFPHAKNREGCTGKHPANGENVTTTQTPPWTVTSPSTATLDFHRATPLFYPTARKQAEDKEMQTGQTRIQTPDAGPGHAATQGHGN